MLESIPARYVFDERRKSVGGRCLRLFAADFLAGFDGRLKSGLRRVLNALKLRPFWRTGFSIAPNQL
jgi:hypothetical protein